MYEKTKLLITLFAVLAIMLITIAILSRFSNNSNSIAIGPKISNISNKAATSITKYNNFSIGYLENLTYPYFVEGNQPKPNGYYDGHFYSGYERYIYTNYSTPNGTVAVLNAEELISPNYYTNPAYVFTYSVTSINGKYIQCFRLNSSSDINCFSSVNDTQLGLNSSSVLPFVHNLFSGLTYVTASGTSVFGDLSTTNATLSNSSFDNQTCKATTSAVYDPSYPSIKGKMYSCISDKFGVPLIMVLSINDPYYGYSNDNITFNLSETFIEQKVDSNYFNMVYNKTQLYPANLLQAGNPLYP